MMKSKAGRQGGVINDRYSPTSKVVGLVMGSDQVQESISGKGIF